MQWFANTKKFSEKYNKHTLIWIKNNLFSQNTTSFRNKINISFHTEWTFLPSLPLSLVTVSYSPLTNPCRALLVQRSPLSCLRASTKHIFRPSFYLWPLIQTLGCGCTVQIHAEFFPRSHPSKESGNTITTIQNQHTLVLVEIWIELLDSQEFFGT